MARQRKTHPAAFKAQVALAALKGDKTVHELAKQHTVHPTLIHAWKKQLLAGSEDLFSNGTKAASTDHEALQAQLYEQIGRLQMELAWVKKNLPSSLEAKRAVIEVDHPNLTIGRQCDLLGLCRSSFYYEPAVESAENLALMKQFDKQYTDYPFYGSRRMAAWLSDQGPEINRKRVQRLMRIMGLEAIYPKPKLSVAGKGHKVFSYLLRDMTIDRVDQVWSTDITYIPMPHGFMYLAAVIDWYSRYVLAWRLSNTLDGAFCLEMLEEALGRGKPEVFNTDQGVQFTAEAFTSRLVSAGVAVSMDGKGRCMDNIFIERLWRSVKYEEIYLWWHDTVPALSKGLGRYFPFYNEERVHQSLDYRTPGEVYREGRSRAAAG